VLGKQPALKAHGGQVAAKPGADSVHAPALQPDAGAGKGKGSAKEDSSGGTADRSSAALGRPVSASSDASFVHVEGSWDDCFAALAQVPKNIFVIAEYTHTHTYTHTQEDYASRAAERLEAAVRAWQAIFLKKSNIPLHL
jgi:hypothetical protein